MGTADIGSTVLIHFAIRSDPFCKLLHLYKISCFSEVFSVI